MKKYLLAAIMAVAVTGAFVSCSDDVVSGSLIEQKAKAFEETFIEAFGQPAPNHTWGFKRNNITEANGVTRSSNDNSCGTCIKPDMTEYPSATAPAPITDDERAYVKQWFEEHPGFTAGLDISNFYVQHVWGEASKEYNVWYEAYDQNYMANHPGATSNYYRADYVDNATMDYFCVGDGTNYTHTLDFNANDDGSGLETVYMQNSSALSFKYHSSWCSSEYTYFKCAQIDVPGVGIGWYVGMCCYGEKQDNGNRYLNKDMKDLQYCDDWIVKIVPGQGTPPPPSDRSKIVEIEEVIEAGRVFCEDLGASSLNDVDYNDVVFDAIIVKAYNKLVTTTTINGEEKTTETTNFTGHYEETYAKIALLAAGGTVPANVCGHEVHNELSGGALGTVVMINTTTDPKDVNGAQIAYSTADVKYGPTIIQETVNGTTTDKIYTNSDGNPITCIDDIDIDVLYGNAVTTITAPKGAVPYKICVPLGTPWAKERVNIGIAFTSFAEYCGINPDKDFWNDITEEGSPASPVWGDCASPFTITNNGVTRYIDEGDVLSYTESEYTGSGGNGGVSGGQIWASTDDAGTEVGYGNNVIVSYDKFTNASATSTIRLNFSYAGSNWQFFAKYGNSDNPFKQIGNYNNISTMSVTSGGYVDFEIGEALTGLQQNGLKIHGNELKISSIELR